MDRRLLSTRYRARTREQLVISVRSFIQSRYLHHGFDVTCRLANFRVADEPNRSPLWPGSPGMTKSGLPRHNFVLQ